jgi:phosphatidylethanolamine-binding protein (PEBP) family uncharacterized protein
MTLTFRRRRRGQKTRIRLRGRGRGERPSLRIEYGSHQVVSGETLQIADVARQPEFHFQAAPDKIYTLVMWDPDARPRGWLHWIVRNIGYDRVPMTVVPYTPPTPPSGIHRYYFALFTGPAVARTAPTQRSGFNINEFIADSGMTLASTPIYMLVPSEARLHRILS